MSDQQDGAEKFALTLVGLLVAAIVAAMIGLGIFRARPAARRRGARGARSQRR